MIKKGMGAITKNLNANANKTAINTILIFTPLKKDSTTFLDAVAPTYLKALKAKKTLGINTTMPPINMEKLVLVSQKTKDTREPIHIKVKDKIICLNANILPGLAKSSVIKNITCSLTLYLFTK